MLNELIQKIVQAILNYFYILKLLILICAINSLFLFQFNQIFIKYKIFKILNYEKILDILIFTYKIKFIQKIK